MDTAKKTQMYEELDRVRDELADLRSRETKLLVDIERAEREEKVQAMTSRCKAWAQRLVADGAVSGSTAHVPTERDSNVWVERYDFVLSNGAQGELVVRHPYGTDP